MACNYLYDFLRYIHTYIWENIGKKVNEYFGKVKIYKDIKEGSLGGMPSTFATWVTNKEKERSAIGEPLRAFHTIVRLLTKPRFPRQAAPNFFYDPATCLRRPFEMKSHSCVAQWHSTRQRPEGYWGWNSTTNEREEGGRRERERGKDAETSVHSRRDHEVAGLRDWSARSDFSLARILNFEDAARRLVT